MRKNVITTKGSTAGNQLFVNPSKNGMKHVASYRKEV